MQSERNAGLRIGWNDGDLLKLAWNKAMAMRVPADNIL